MRCVPQGAATSVSHAMTPASLEGVAARLSRTGSATGRLAPQLREEWVLTIPPRWRGRSDPLTGWWGAGDPLETITLRFSSRQAAESYARREGLVLEVSDAPGTLSANGKASTPAPEVVDPILPWVWDGRAAAMDLDPGESGAGRINVERALLNPAAVFSAPMDVVRHPRLSRQEKRDILRQWEWDARQIEAAQAEGMPETGESSRLEEVLEAQRALAGPQPREGWVQRPSAGAQGAPAHATPEWRLAA